MSSKHNVHWRIAVLVPTLVLASLMVSAFALAHGAASFAASHPPDRPVVKGAAGPGTRKALAPEARLATNDDCLSATPVTLTVDAPLFADRVLAASATISDTDPMQSCTWSGSSTNSHSIWWRITVPEDGRLTVRTITENPRRYDTVVTIYPADAGCGLLGPDSEVGCDDDTHAFQSEASALVDRMQAYLVEVTAWGDVEEGDELDLSCHYAPDTRWQHPSGAGLPFPLTRHTSVGDGRYLYVLGGYSSGPSDAVYRLEATTGIWTGLREMDRPYSDTDGAYADGRIFIPSGYAGAADGSPYEGTHFAYNISDDTWSVLSSAPWDTEPIAWGAAAASPSETAYYYTGGRRGTLPSVPLPDVFEYNIASDAWRTLPPMTTPRYAHRAALLGDELCVVGGLDQTGEPFAGTECFDFAAREWSPVADLNLPRHSFGDAIGADGRWYVFGGIVGDTVTSTLATAKTEVYDAQTDTWTLLDQRWSLHQGREWPAGARVGSRIFALGGFLAAKGVIVSTQEWLDTGAEASYLPLVLNGAGAAFDRHEPNDAMPAAHGPLTVDVPIASIFARAGDSEDFFFFETETPGAVRVALTGIPEGSNYDLYLYDHAKGEVAASITPSNADEYLEAGSLPTGTYFVRVRNAIWSITSSQFYSLLISR